MTFVFFGRRPAYLMQLNERRSFRVIAVICSIIHKNCSFQHHNYVLLVNANGISAHSSIIQLSCTSLQIFIRFTKIYVGQIVNKLWLTICSFHIPFTFSECQRETTCEIIFSMRLFLVFFSHSISPNIRWAMLLLHVYVTHIEATD